MGTWSASTATISYGLPMETEDMALKVCYVDIQYTQDSISLHLLAYLPSKLHFVDGSESYRLLSGHC